MADKIDYKSTILLPKTEFPMRANLAQREPAILERWQKEGVYARALEARRSAPRYVFHDGPPYANAHIHYGHILNKTLKDLVVKYETIAGRLTRFVPGWDCHGLPIELNVERALGQKKQAQLSALELRAACRKEAEKWVAVQRGEFERLGIFATWETPYLTMDASFERGILECLAAFLRHGLVYRGKKPVHWCGHDHTALAEAEVEYQDHTSPSIYVKFPIEGMQAQALADKLGFGVAERAKPLYALIWTTTPWTLPANLAIAVHPTHAYTAVDVGGEHWLLASELVASVLKATGRSELARSAAVPGAALAGIEARHPFEERASPLLTAEHVTLEAGTGLVHTAPGHGADDYRLGQEHGLDTFAPVDEAARFTNEVREEWRGLHVLEANPRIVHFLAEHGRLANREGESIRHSYPCCWRCKNPVIFRATTQWFIALDQPLRGRGDGQTLRQLALHEIDAIAAGRELGGEGLASGFIPAWGRDRIHGMLSERPDWCISRQRVWGVPIPALHCRACGHAVLDEALCNHVAEIVGREGGDAWYRRDAAELAPKGFTCPGCGGTSFEKDRSILDVWFESGSSFWATMRDAEAGLGLPVDLYLEGSDQHRGWFHSSLLVGAAVLGRAPYKRVLTHGFVCDDQGRPYSKSDIRRRQEAGEKVEYVEPEVVIKQQGAELFRLWVAYEDFRGDMRYSPDHMKQVSDAYFKIRNTLRFLLGNLHDHRPGSAPAALDPLDRWAAARLRRYLGEVVRAYERYDFRTVYHRTLELCSGDWSAFYLDVVKDRLYCDAADAPRRRSCQHMLDQIARATIAALAPITSFTAEEAYQHLPGARGGSVFLDLELRAPAPLPEDAALLDAGEGLATVRDAVNLVLEPRVKQKEIAHRREVAVRLTLPPALRDRIELFVPDLADVLAVASVDSAPGPALAAEVRPTSAPQCQRCWRHRADVGRSPGHPALCTRCADVLSGQKS